MSNGASTPSAFKRVFVGDDAGYAVKVDPNDLFQIAGPYGPILRVGSTPTEDYVIWTGTANTSFGEIDIGTNLANYFTMKGAASGAIPTINTAGVDTNIPLGLLPKGLSPVVTTELLVAPTANWVTGSANFVTRVRPQFQVFQSSTTVPTGLGFYPQMSVTGGTVGGFADAGGAGLSAFNTISVDGDNVVANSGAGPQGLNLLNVGLGVGNSNGAAGSAHKGGRNAINGEIFINSDVDIGTGSLFHVGVAGGTTAFYKMGGVPGAARGNVFGGNVWARAYNNGGPGPRYLLSIIGMEVGIRQEANVSALWKIGLQIVGENTSDANAEQQNIGLSITDQPSATTRGYGQGISFGAYNGQFPMAASGQMIATLPTPIGLSSVATADGINFRRVAFSRSSLDMPGFFVDGSGNTGGQKVGGLALQTVSAVDAKVSTVSSVAIVDGGSYDGGPSIATTATYLGGATAITVASFSGVLNGMLVSGANIQAGTTLVSGAGTVNFVLSLPTTGPGTGVAIAFTQPMPPFAIASPATSGGIAGTTATMIVTNMGADGLTGINAGGNGLYVAGETLTAVGGTGTAFTLFIETVVAGVPTNVRIATAGNYTVLPTNPILFTGSAAGTGFSVGARWTILALASGGSGGSLAGTNYNELRPPTVTYTGAATQTREARFRVNMSAGTSVNLVLNSGAMTQTTNLEVGDQTGRQTFKHATFISPVAGSMATPPFLVQGSAFGTVTSGAAFYRSFNVGTDTVDASAALGGGATANYFGHTISAGAVGGRTTLFSFLNQTGATTSALNTFYVSHGAFAQASASAGGSAGLGNHRGNLFGSNISAELKSGAGLFWNAVVGLEINVGLPTGTQSYYKHGLSVIQWNTDAVSGVGGADSGLMFATQTAGSVPGWDRGITFGHPLGWWPIKAAGTMIGTLTGFAAGPTYAATWGVDFSAVTFSSGFLRSTGFSVDGVGTTSTTGRIVGVRVVTAAGAVTVAATDETIVVNKTVGAATVVNLPAGVLGRRYTIKDGKGDAAANNITITPAAGNIDGAATSVINTNYGRATVAYNGTQWNLV
jgi:hypothetical protein